tara:strand:+ start:59 stop:1045 length:987 start_codon:yes stop_codon:yes gene_type:complete
MHGRKKSTRGPTVKWLHRLAQATLAAMCLASSLAAHASERQSIPFDLDTYGNIVVSLTLNDDTPAIGVVDTAATYAMIGMATAKRAGIAPPDATMVNVLGLEGPQAYPIVYLDSIAAGNCRFTDVAAALNQRIEVVGVKNVVPLTVLDGGVVDFDFVERRILIYDGRPDRNTSMATSRLPMREIHGLWFAEVTLNGHKGLALIDTGSSISYINSRFAADAGVKANPEKTHILQGITGNGVAARVVTARGLQLGKHRASRPDLIVADPPLFEHLGMVDTPAMVLGLDYLSFFRVQLDRHRSYLVLSLQPQNKRTISVRQRSGATHLRDD